MMRTGGWRGLAGFTAVLCVSIGLVLAGWSAIASRSALERTRRQQRQELAVVRQTLHETAQAKSKLADELTMVRGDLARAHAGAVAARERAQQALASPPAAPPPAFSKVASAQTRAAQNLTRQLQRKSVEVKVLEKRIDELEALQATLSRGRAGIRDAQQTIRRLQRAVEELKASNQSLRRGLDAMREEKSRLSRELKDELKAANNRIAELIVELGTQERLLAQLRESDGGPRP